MTVFADCGDCTFSDALGSTVASTCATCVAGKYAASSASTVCTDCPAGKISAVATACSEEFNFIEVVQLPPVIVATHVLTLLLSLPLCTDQFYKVYLVGFFKKTF